MTGSKNTNGLTIDQVKTSREKYGRNTLELQENRDFFHVVK